MSNLETFNLWPENSILMKYYGLLFATVYQSMSEKNTSMARFFS